MPNKIYPRYGFDKGVKWFRNDGDKHYTMRLAGNPLMILQGVYEKSGGTDFIRVYNIAKESKLGMPIPDNDQQNISILRVSTKKTNDILDILNYLGNENKSPFVIYQNDISDFR